MKNPELNKFIRGLNKICKENQEGADELISGGNSHEKAEGSAISEVLEEITDYIKEFKKKNK